MNNFLQEKGDMEKANKIKSVTKNDNDNKLSQKDKKFIEIAVKKVVKEYGETLRLLAQE